MFTTDCSDYNVLIKLRPRLLPRRFEAIGHTGVSTQNNCDSREFKFPVTNFNPAEIFLEELRVSSIQWDEDLKQIKNYIN